jgi:hypothetical protein
MSSSKEAPKTPPLGVNALRNLIQASIARGYLEESEHAEVDHPERNLSIDDILYGLEQPHWTFVKAPDYDCDHGTWEYLIKTTDIEGNDLEIKLAAYPEYKKVRIITRW